MVGILGLGSRNTPPSPDVRRYETSNAFFNGNDTRNLLSEIHPSDHLPAAASSTHGNTVTSGSSPFFSLPLWTRRILPGSAAARKIVAEPSLTDEHGAISRRPSTHKLRLDKQLPPTPRDSNSPFDDSTTSATGAHYDRRETQGVTHIQEGTPTPSSFRRRGQPIAPPVQPAIYLDVYHNTPLVTEPNIVSFTPQTARRAEHTLRPSRSTNSLVSGGRASDSSSTWGSAGTYRTRGISLMPSSTNKNRETIFVGAGDGHPPTPLTRKSSFWARKLMGSSPQNVDTSSQLPSLPAVHPASPFQVDFETPPSPFQRQRGLLSPTRLSRRHSERASRTAGSDVPSLAQNSLMTNVRPSTADPSQSSKTASRPTSRRPTTADSSTRYRSRSFFAFSSQSVTTSSVPHPLHAVKSTRPFTKDSSAARPRSATNPPLFHRLSVNLFASSPSEAKTGTVLGSVDPLTPVSRSPRPSLSQISPEVLRPQSNDSPESFVKRLICVVSKADIAGVLASSGENIYADSLRWYLGRFSFSGDPLDVALRKLLMDVGLPRETQQIDRVIEAFANRYLACNPDLFTSSDQPYILAFSLIMLHTDAFNRSNRRKMTKTDYMKNTSLPGLIPEVLACFYDNIVFAPFIFIEDPLDMSGGSNHESGSTRPSTSSGLPSPMSQPGNALLSKPKIDPYYLITHNLLHQLRVNVEDYIPLENPYRWDGTGASWNYDELLLAFAKGHVIEIASTDSKLPSAFFGLTAGGMPSPSLTGVGGMPDLFPVPSELWSLKLTKVAVLSRKDDSLEGGKKPMNRKWRPFSVALTESQLLLFRDLSWTSILLSGDRSRRVPIQSTIFKPDEVVPLNNVLAVFDRSYTRHLNTFRLTIPDGRHMLFQTTDEKEMNQWISRINYASAFKTAGVKMRPLGMSERDVELTGVAAATSHLHDLHMTHSGQPRVLTWGHRALDCPDESTSDAHPADASGHASTAMDMDAPSVQEVEGASQFKDTFDTVKAELAAATHAGEVGPTATADDRVVFPRCSVERSRPSSVAHIDSSHLAPRSQMVRSRVQDLEAQICATNAQIDSSMHLARNIAVLVPFQKSTRDRLQDVIQNLSRQIQTMRLDVTRLICHRNILLNDLAAEERGFKIATALALQAATETLQSYRLKSTYHTQDIGLNGSSPEGSSPAVLHSFDSSIGDSYRSALDFGPDWPSNGETFTSATLLETCHISESPMTEACDDSSAFPDTNLPLSKTVGRSLQDLPLRENSVPEQDLPEEQAEEWNKTRAAKRVSLVKVPSDLRPSMLGRSSRHHPGTSLLNLHEEPYSIAGRTDPGPSNFRTPFDDS